MDFAPLYRWRDGTTLGRITSEAELLRFAYFFYPHFKELHQSHPGSLIPSNHPTFGVKSANGEILSAFYFGNGGDIQRLEIYVGNTRIHPHIQWIWPFGEDLLWPPEFSPYEWTTLKPPVFVPDILWDIAKQVPDEISRKELVLLNDAVGGMGVVNFDLPESRQPGFGFYLVPRDFPRTISSSYELIRFIDGLWITYWPFDPLSPGTPRWRISWNPIRSSSFIGTGNSLWHTLLRATSFSIESGSYLILQESREDEWREFWRIEPGEVLVDVSSLEPYWLFDTPSPLLQNTKSFLAWYEINRRDPLLPAPPG